MGINFYESEGALWLSCSERRRDGGYNKSHGVVPQEVIAAGQSAVREYASREIEKLRAGIKHREDAEDEIKRNPIPISVKYKGTVLEGRVIGATARYIDVELLRPVKGRGGMNFGFASGIAGHHVFGSDDQISEHGYNAARTALQRAYERALNKPVSDLAEELNVGDRKKDFPVELL